PKLTGAPEMQTLGVAPAPRELEQPGARRAGDAQRVGQPLLVEAVQFAPRRRRAARALRARVVEAAHGLEPHGGARDPSGHLEAHGQRGEERGTAKTLALPDGEGRRPYGG